VTLRNLNSVGLIHAADDPSAVLAKTRWYLSKKRLWLAIIVAHAVFFIGLSDTMLRGAVQGDLQLYRHWAFQGLVHGSWPGIDFAWVYPEVALLPVVFAGLWGFSFYLFVWLCMISAVNIASFVALVGRRTSRSRMVAAWWWLAILVVLSPVALLRLDGLTAPMVVIALVLLSRWPLVTGAILAVATWIKVWPAAIFLAIVATSRTWLSVVMAGVITSAAVVAVILTIGAGGNISSFITMQSTRNLQLEAPIAAPWLWMSIANQPGFARFYGQTLETWEVTGPGSSLVAKLMTPLMAAAVVAIMTLLWRARKNRAPAQEMLLVGSLALATAMVVFNKVGSPQYMLWLVPIVVVGIALNTQAWRIPANLMMGISIMTTMIFPIFYMPLVNGSRYAAILLTSRNALLLALFGWVIMRLVQLGTARQTESALAEARPRLFARKEASVFSA
jgi:molybdopterin-binding protein